MYAVIATGGKQYKVKPGQLLRLEKLSGKIGDEIKIKPILMASSENEPKIGRPYLEGHVSVTIEEQSKSRKILIFKKKRRKGYRIKRGHRQHYTAVRVKTIEI